MGGIDIIPTCLEEAIAPYAFCIALRKEGAQKFEYDL
jgi:hypothetical protein